MDGMQEGKSPLHHCAQSSSLQVANLLIQHGAALHLPDNENITPLQLVVRTHNLNMLQVILNHHQCVTTDEGDDFAGSVLMSAVDGGALPVVKFLLLEGYVGVEYQNRHGETAMHRALLQKRGDVTELLRTVDEEARSLVLTTTTNESCLHYAAQYSLSEELQRLLDFYGQRRSGELAGEEEPSGLREEGVAVLLNGVNSTSHTALFLAATSTLDSLDVRNSKTQLMLNAGVKMLGSSPFIEATFEQMPRLSVILFSTEVQRCLCLWLSECAVYSLNGVTKFCVDYLSIISSLHHPQLGIRHQALGVLLSSGQAVDTAPLMVLLPFDRRLSLPLLEHIGLFGRQQNHSLLLALYQELAAAWTGLVAQP
ncbi:unnamed protein product [Phytophthora lilii]|uniref:Unnamed protein product n=1 Tax=Phytophthora lilii TaxID=2077276 RepID=A0A9W7DAZ4_9STRA|nr:unnamed protein product [Phytophthora lilii]